MNLKPDYDFLPQISAFIGVTTLLIGAFTIAVPMTAAKVWRVLPRSVWPGRILAAVCILWSALWLCVMPLGPLSVVRDSLWILIPIAVASVCVFTPELLTCRAIGGILVLLPAPMLSAAAWHPSPFRYVILIYAYAMAITGMYYIALPWLLRDHITWSLRKPMRQKAVALSAVMLGLFITVLSVTVYRVV